MPFAYALDMTYQRRKVRMISKPLDWAAGIWHYLQLKWVTLKEGQLGKIKGFS